MIRTLSRSMGTREVRRLIELLGDPPDINNLPADYWSRLRLRVAASLTPLMEELALATGATLMQSQPIGVEWGLVNRRAAQWARRYTFDLVTGINRTTQDALQEKIAAFYEEQQTLRDLRRSLEPLFGLVRAEMIAATETTRAAVEGERRFVEELNREGVQLTPFHVTNRDDIVCPICRPRHKEEITMETEWPPLHVRCRCWVVWKYLRERGRAVG